MIRFNAAITRLSLPYFFDSWFIMFSKLNFVFVSFLWLQFKFIHTVPLCNCNNNIRKQVYMAFEDGLFNK